ncbi:MAG TPA: trimethylamine methyltransferase family protein [Roseiflexaceae bacterium]|nr:trimethylamine methyltransferase family protein [Roseiflexaceae bacterium]HMP42545.1 trimethylamine methyltransferase family protein [Roseiflexaceae bacterium]
MTDSTERRRERRARQAAARQTPMQPITYDLPLYNLLDTAGLDRLHAASLRILSEYGIDFYDDEVLAILRNHGVKLDGSTAFFSAEQIERFVALAPTSFVQLARNPANSVTIGGNQVIFAPVYGPPFVQDLAGGRREATLADFENFVKLAYLSPYIHHSGGTIVEPTDEPVPTRHLDMILSHIRYSDKPFMGSVTSGENAADSVAMAEIVFGAAAIRTNPALLSLINVSSPRRYDERMLAAILVYARARQAMIITPFILAGAMGPTSIAGTLAQQNAEALAGIALCQMIEPGTPVVYGSFLTNIDLQSGAPVFGSPESQIGLYVSAQLARRYGLPFRGGGMFSSSKLPDAQAGYESMMVMLPTMMARTNFVLHAAGWLENGLVAGYEKFVLDCEILGMLHTWARGLDLSDEGLALDAIAEVPPGGHFLGTAHTMRHFRDAFYRAELFDYNSAEQWELNGSPDSYTRAADKVRQLLAAYQPPELNPAIDAALRAFVVRRKAELLEMHRT